MEPLKIQHIPLPHRAVFGPMAGFTDAPCRRLHGAVRLCPSRIFLHGTCIFCQMSLFDEMIAKIL